MAEFMVRTDMLHGTAAKLEFAKVGLNAAGIEINDVRKHLPNVLSPSGAIIKLRLFVQRSNVLEEAVKLSSMADCIAYIASEYERCEREILGGGLGITFSAAGQDKRSWIRKLLEKWGLIGKKDERVYATNDEQEREMDEYLKRESERLLKEKYTAEKWRSATVEERKQMLTDYMNDLEELMGVNVDEDIRFFDEKPKNGLVTNGSYNDFTKRVSINTYLVNNAYGSDYAFDVIAHEMRHAYQHAAVNDPDSFQVSAETIEKWEYNFDHYVSCDTTKGDDGSSFDAYQNQAVEEDARWFAGQ